MGYSRRRKGVNGRITYQAIYRDAQGRRQYAGTYAKKKAADRAWQRAEVKVAEGKPEDPRRGRQSFRTYVLEHWLPNHRMEATTRQDYTYAIKAHLMPFFENMRMRDITAENVREWITWCKGRNVSAHRIRYCKSSILNAIFTTALDDHVIVYHPSRGVKTDPVPEKPRKIVTAEQFGELYAALPGADAQLLIETEIESGLRWGELTEFRVRDLDLDTQILTVSRAVVELTPEFHPEGKRFLVKQYPKGKRWRRFKLSAQIVAKLKAHIEAEGLGPDDLLFARRLPPPQLVDALPDPEDIEFVAPNGRSYRHATITAYNLGKCKCNRCRGAYAAYRAKRRTKGKDRPPRPRQIAVPDDDAFISANWFRKHIWYPAREAADLGFKPRIHDLRHAHASWLLAGGADLQVVKERLGHRKIATTERYLHSLPNADETALAALDKIRNGQGGHVATEEAKTELETARGEIARLKTMIADHMIAQYSEQGPNPCSV